MPGVKGMSMPKCPPGCTCGKHKTRRNTGRKCPPGCKCGRHVHPQSAETRRKISESHIKRVQEQGETPLPDKKKCSACKKWKRLPEDFSLKPHKLKSGLVRRYPDSKCKKCRNERNKEWVKKQGPKKMAERRRLYRENQINKLGIEEFRRRENEKRMFQRHREGKKRAKARTSPGEEIKVNRGPLVKFIKSEMERTGATKNSIAIKGGIKPSLITYVLQGWEPAKKTKSGRTSLSKISLKTVDGILQGLGQEEMLTILYPDEEK